MKRSGSSDGCFRRHASDYNHLNLSRAMSSMQVGIEDHFEVIKLEDETNRTIDDEKSTADEVRNK